MRERFLKRIALAVVFVFLTQTSLLAYQAPFFAPLPQLAPGVTAASVIITAPSVAYQSHLGVSSSQFRGDFGESLMRYFFTEGGDLSANKRWYSVDPGTVYAGKDGLILSAPDRPSRSGIDGLFMQYDAKGNPRGIMVVESKFGSSQLGMTRDGRQMSAYWIENCLRKTVEHLNRIKAGSKMISSATPPSPANASNTITISLGKGHTVKIWQDNRSKSYYFYSERPVTEKLIFKQMDKQAAFIKGVLDGKISMDSLLFNFDVNREGVLKLEIKKLSSSGGVVSVKSVDTISGKMFSQLSKQHQDIFRKSFVETIARSYQAQGYSADKAMEMAKNLMSQAEKKGDKHVGNLVRQFTQNPKFNWEIVRNEGVKAGLVSAGWATAISSLQLVAEWDFSRERLLMVAKEAAFTGTAVALGVWSGHLTAHFLEKGVKFLTSSNSQISTAVTRVLDRLGGIEKLSAFSGGIAGGMMTSTIFAYGAAVLGLTDFRTANRMMLTGAASTIAGSVAGWAIMGGAMAFGKASTGTAIATLYGVAAKNAALAWLGGGVSAFGMAGGAVVLSGGILLAGLAARVLLGAIWRSLDNAEEHRRVEYLLKAYS
ncbi:MAG: hypothetical protein ACOX5A_00735 [Aminivibrio sp.]